MTTQGLIIAIAIIGILVVVAIYVNVRKEKFSKQ